MKNIALIKSIIAASISSANTAELTEHIVALIQAHPEEIRENALAILTGTVKALSTVTTPLNVIVEMYIAGLEAKLQALRALVK